MKEDLEISKILNGVADPGLPDDRITAHFWEFHRANPWVYAHLVRSARQWKAKGNSKTGIEMFWALLRWDVGMGTIHPTGDYRLNDHYTSRYSRLITAQEPDLVGIFEQRRLRSK